MDIYQQIWDADQAANGVQPILSGQQGDEARGYVSVANTVGAEEETRVLDKVVIPDAKRLTYDRVLKLFDNYALDEQEQEVETPQERQEVHDLLAAVIDTPPMQVAREYVANASGTVISRDRWYGVLLEHWFRTFSQGGDPALTGFEHVFVGEQEGPKVQGYHFWYKYYLDDGLATTYDRDNFPGFADDRIAYVRGLYENGQENFPESVTISYKWHAPDYSRWSAGDDPKEIVRPLTKPVGGFFVGCSVEGLMAIGSVRAHLGARAPKEAVINGARYDLKVFRSANDQHIRTFYPVFLGPAGRGGAEGPVVIPRQPEQPQEPAVQSPIRILAALVNPEGTDEDKETVTLINTGAAPQSLEGWFLVDKTKRRFAVNDVTLAPGVATTILLPRNSIQLSNKGGEIRLVNRDGHTAHVVTYSKAQASDQGRTIVF
ncbi:lamin tail domain-containing protein [Rhizobium puerariae]|uniref:Lamin tail domain-containing protein n=1 Tax=Rhizobium puerariae TaxID=1585791 RepID=A0ABV6ABW2_9HYPH